MRYFTIPVATCALVASVLSAAVADPPASSPWSGPYAGLTPGFTQADATFAPYTVNITQVSGILIPGRGVVIVPGTTRPMSVSHVSTGYGGAGGLQLGYNRQRHRFVWGIEADVTAGGATGTSTSTMELPATALQVGKGLTFSRSITITSMFALLPRLGIASNRDLLYALAGPTWTNVTINGAESDIANPADAITQDARGNAVTCPGSFCPGNFPANPYVSSASDRNVHNGFAFGLGWEHKLSKNTSVGVEYRHASLGTRNYTVGATDITESCKVQTLPVTSPPTLSSCAPGASTGTLGSDAVNLSSTAVNLKLNFRLR